MLSFSDLPPDLHDVIFKNMPTKTVFDLLSKKSELPYERKEDSQSSEIPPDRRLKKLINQAREELFSRRGEAASDCQNALLRSWVIHLFEHHTLSFIRDNDDKKAWAILVAQALKDPKASLTHKVNVCLFINQLFPFSSKTIINIEKRFDEGRSLDYHLCSHELGLFYAKLPDYKINAFLSEIKKEMVKPLLEANTHLYGRLRNLSHVIFKPQHASILFSMIMESMGEVLKKGNPFELYYLGQILRTVLSKSKSNEQEEALFNILLKYFSDPDLMVRTHALELFYYLNVTPRNTDQFHRIFSLLLAIKTDSQKLDRAKVQGLYVFKNKLCQEEVKEIFTFLLNKIKSVDNSVVKEEVVYILNVFLPEFSATMKEVMCDRLVMHMSYSNRDVRVQIMLALEKLAPSICHDQQKQTVFDLQMKEMDMFDHKIIFSALSSLISVFPSGALPFYSFIIEKINATEAHTQRTFLKALEKVNPRIFTQEQVDVLFSRVFHVFSQTIGIDYKADLISVLVNLDKNLGTAAQRNAIFDYVEYWEGKQYLLSIFSPHLLDQDRQERLLMRSLKNMTAPYDSCSIDRICAYLFTVYESKLDMLKLKLDESHLAGETVKFIIETYEFANQLTCELASEPFYFTERPTI
jgi:hypothetical protein